MKKTFYGVLIAFGIIGAILIAVRCANGEVVTERLSVGGGAPVTTVAPADLSSLSNAVTDPSASFTLLTAAPTVTVSRATGRYMALDCTNNVVLQFSTNNLLNETMYGFRLDVRLNAFSLTWDTNYFMSTNLATITTTNVFVPVVGVRPYGGGLIEVR